MGKNKGKQFNIEKRAKKERIFDIYRRILVWKIPKKEGAKIEK